MQILQPTPVRPERSNTLHNSIYYEEDYLSHPRSRVSFQPKQNSHFLERCSYTTPPPRESSALNEVLPPTPPTQSSTQSQTNKLFPPSGKTHLLKTKMCNLYLQGKCFYGDSCYYAHNFSELRKSPKLSKTSLCKQFLANQCFKSSADCSYAHSPSELHATYKSVLCMWWLNGHCTHGDSCRFAHGESELRNHPFDEQTTLRSANRAQTCIGQNSIDNLPSYEELCHSLSRENASSRRWTESPELIKDDSCTLRSSGNSLLSTSTEDLTTSTGCVLCSIIAEGSIKNTSRNSTDNSSVICDTCLESLFLG